MAKLHGGTGITAQSTSRKNDKRDERRTNKAIRRQGKQAARERA